MHVEETVKGIKVNIDREEIKSKKIGVKQILWASRKRIKGLKLKTNHFKC